MSGLFASATRFLSVNHSKPRQRARLSSFSCEDKKGEGPNDSGDAASTEKDPCATQSDPCNTNDVCETKGEEDACPTEDKCYNIKHESASCEKDVTNEVCLVKDFTEEETDNILQYYCNDCYKNPEYHMYNQYAFYNVMTYLQCQRVHQGKTS